MAYNCDSLVGSFTSYRIAPNTELHQIIKRTLAIHHYQRTLKMRKANSIIANKLDGKSEKIPDHFSNTYNDLFNSIDDHENLKVVKENIDIGINQDSNNYVNKVTPEVVKDAVMHLNNEKTDPQFSFSSDCFKNAPDQLFEHLSNIFKIFLIHGHVSLFVLISTMVPLIKNKLGDKCSSKNYRSIAISSLILKVLDWVILILFGDLLKLDELQFGYQAGCSTTMATWMALETISYFLRNGSEVFVCLMDMTKAFDMVQHSLLFKKLLDSGLPPIFVRILFFMYLNQKANVRWGGVLSKMFKMSHGVKQGAVISAILYCFYTNSLFQLLRDQKVGCWIQGKFTGAVGYADDNLVMSPTLEGLQTMMSTCEKFASEHNLQFSTNPDPKKSKTKCVAYGNNLPWINSPDTVNHL